LLAAGQLLTLEQERQKAMLRALSAGSGTIAGINLAAVGLAAGGRNKLAVSAVHEAKLRCVWNVIMGEVVTSEYTILSPQGGIST
jgi:hypothetical protein